MRTVLICGMLTASLAVLAVAQSPAMQETAVKMSGRNTSLKYSLVPVSGGKITGVQIVSYPDHRSQSLYLIQLEDPILTTEVIKTQQSRVNTVSSATNSSIAFRDAIAGAIIKATR
jgi:uncharacterized protein with FMN-binding domain